MAERMIEIDRIELCTEPLGDPTDPRILIMGWPAPSSVRSLASGISSANATPRA